MNKKAQSWKTNRQKTEYDGTHMHGKTNKPED